MKKCDFLVELCVEDFPVSSQSPVAREIASRIAELFEGEGISFSENKVLFSPRRIAVIFKGVSREIPEKKSLIKGPPSRISFDSDGHPTEILKGFLRKNSANIDDLRERNTEKGKYVFAEIRSPARRTENIIREKIPRLLENLKFPNSMRWNGFSFPRPVRNVLLLFGRKPLRVKCFGINSSASSRDFYQRPLKVLSPTLYEKTLERRNIIVDAEKRKERILSAFSEISERSEEEIKINGKLLAETVGICEYPTAVDADFDERFLSIPAEIVEETLKVHQKCFSVLKDGKISAKFVFVMDGISRNVSEIKANYRRCVEARLEDTVFFWKEDTSTGLEKFFPQLSKINTIGLYKNLYEKSMALMASCAALSAIYAPEKKDKILKTAKLLNCDQASKLVYEFPQLHGTAGYYLSQEAGIDGEVCRAILDAVSGKPGNAASEIVGLVDRLNTLKSFFHAGIVPTSSKDPFGGRRVADEAIKILIRSQIPFEISKIKKFVFGDCSEDVFSKVIDFLKDRFAIFLKKNGVSPDVISAVAGDFEIPGKRFLIAVAIEKIKKENKNVLSEIAAAHRRVENILKQAADVRAEVPAEVFGLGENSAEKKLETFLKEISGEIFSLARNGDFEHAILKLAEIKPALDRFFDSVLIMDRDPAVRGNRLFLVSEADAVFSAFARFAEVRLENKARRGSGKQVVDKKELI
ncbi:MAG: glycine--tRNA ligase subunit beta [Elusimicrobia bacterium]|nr:glycine--tRNA ligase subunit beta [Elusimicrobiota bacterium]